MPRDKGAFGKTRTQFAIIAKGKAQRGGMRAQGIIWTPFIFALFRFQRFYTGIGETTPIMLRPAIVGAKLNQGKIIRHKV